MNEAENNRLAELLVELAAGNIDVLTDIALLMQKILCGVGNMYFKNKEDLEDSIHDIYLVLCEKAKKFHTNTSASGWIVKVYENWVKTQLRKKRREARYIKGEIENIKTRVNDTSEQYMENHLYLQEIMCKLSDYECDLVIYYYWCKCTVREVANILHRPSATVDYHLKKLQKKLKEEEIEEQQRA